MHVQMEPRAIFVLRGRTVEEDNLTFVPTLVRLFDVSKIERRTTIAALRGYQRDATLVVVMKVRRVVVVPNVHRQPQPLREIKQIESFVRPGRIV